MNISAGYNYITIGEDERQNLIKHYKYIRSNRAGSGAISVCNKCRTIFGTYYCCLDARVTKYTCKYGYFNSNDATGAC